MQVQKLLIAAISLLISLPVLAQNDAPVHPTDIGKGTFWGISQPLKDIPALTEAEFQALKTKASTKDFNEELQNREYPFAKTAFPKGPDAAWQKTMGNAAVTKDPIMNFEGQNSSSSPPDCNGTAGPNHFMQTVNVTYAIYSKTGALLAGPTNMNKLFGSVPGANCNDGDPIILYDDQADRWLAAEFSLCGSTDRMLIAVSTTNDPTGTWYQYSFDVADMPDYEKFGVWQDGYYMGTNNGGKNDIYVFERSKMLTGDISPQMVGFTNPWRPTTIDGFMCVPPVDNDGGYAPAGSPGLFITMNDDAVGGGIDELWIYELVVDWANTTLSTFKRQQQIPVKAFDSNFGKNWTNIKQKGTTQELDAIPQVIMNVPQYRNFGTYQTIVCCHTVDVDATDHAGIRWYELRKTTDTWTVRQTGTYAPDEHSRWMGSIMLNAKNKIGLGYSISSSAINPGIRYAGQTDVAYAAGEGILDAPEGIIQTGTNSQTGNERWGDYALMSVDPSDNETFWFTTEYIGSTGGHKTKIASFKIDNSPLTITREATAILPTSATLNGIVNPNSLATNYYFEWGLTTSYGNVTETLPISGIVNLDVNASISGLVSGNTYHFRLVATNKDGTSKGNDFSFAPGVVFLSTTALSGISQTGAISGGNITFDGGSPVIARGVCWATTSKPLKTDNHTIDGSGTGTYTSAIAGLNPSSTYYIRSYATNAISTYYGNELTFSTLCNLKSLPFTESFLGTSLPTCWNQVDNQGNGQVWQFGTISGQAPIPLLTGNYAYLNSRGYGVGNSQNVDLVSPSFNIGSFPSMVIQFKHYFKSYSGSSGSLSYSTNNGTSWNSIQLFTTTSTSNPSIFNKTIEGLAGKSEIKFKWNYTGSRGYFWSIDDMLATGVSADSLAVTPVTQNVTSFAGSISFKVSTPATWTATCDTTWCSVTPEGIGYGIMEVTFKENTSTTSRTVIITLNASGIGTRTVSVVQQGYVPSLSVTPQTNTVIDTAGSVKFNIIANTTWACVSDVNWCKATPSGSGSGIITATYDQNLSAAIRTATIKVNGMGVVPVNIKVIQLPSFVALDKNPENTIELYPNPTSGLFVISSASFERVKMIVTIIDSRGNAIQTKQLQGSKSYTLDLSKTAFGNYYLKIESEGKTHVMKVVVK